MTALRPVQASELEVGSVALHDEGGEHAKACGVLDHRSADVVIGGWSRRDQFPACAIRLIRLCKPTRRTFEPDGGERVGEPELKPEHAVVEGGADGELRLKHEDAWAARHEAARIPRRHRRCAQVERRRRISLVEGIRWSANRDCGPLSSQPQVVTARTRERRFRAWTGIPRSERLTAVAPRAANRHVP